MTGVRRPELADGDDGGILSLCFESALIRLFGLAGKVYAGGVREGPESPRGRCGPGEQLVAVLLSVA